MTLTTEEMERREDPTRPVTRQEIWEERDTLKQRLAEDNAVCICGCDEHESYGEDGESCGNPEHDCLRVCVVVRDLYQSLKQRLERLDQQRGTPYEDLLRKLQQAEQRIEELERALREHAIPAVESLDEEALGRHPELGYFYRDELLQNLHQAVRRCR